MIFGSLAMGMFIAFIPGFVGVLLLVGVFLFRRGFCCCLVSIGAVWKKKKNVSHWWNQKFL